MANGRRSGKGGGCLKLLLVFFVCVALLFIAGNLGFRPPQTPPSWLGDLTSRVEELLPVNLGDLGVFGGTDDGSSALGQQEAARLDAQLADAYVYSQLDEHDKEKYRIMLDAFQTRAKREYPYSGVEDMAHVRDLVMADHPEFFDISSVHSETITTTGLFSSSEVTTVEGAFDYDEATSASMRQQLEEAAATCLGAMPQGLDDYGKAKYLYDYIAANVSYDWNAAQALASGSEQHLGQTAYDALVNRLAVCGGYARAFQFLAQRTGLQCQYVTGTASGQSHAWVVVRLDGAYYHVDPTRADPQFADASGQNVESSEPSYDYLCIPTDDVLLTHTMDANVPIAPCTSMADNYFVRENAYFTSPDVEYVGALIQNALANGRGSAQFRCADRGVYDQLLYELFEEGRIYAYLPTSTCRYVLNDKLLTVRVLL